MMQNEHVAAGGGNAWAVNLVRLCSEGILVVSPEGQIRFANPAAIELLGLPKGRLEKQVFGFPAALEEPTLVTIWRRDREAVRVEMRASEITWQDEPALLINLHDVSAARMAHEKAQRLAAIVESSDDAIIGKSLDGTITSWNPGATQMYGYTAEEAIGANIAMLIPPDCEDELERLMHTVHQGEAIDSVETIRLCKQGARVRVSLSVSPLRNEHGEVVGAAAIARDISEVYRQREALQTQTEELQERVKEQACMYGVCRVAYATDSVAELVRRVAPLLPAGWKNPEATCARMTIDGHVGQSRDCRESAWCQRARIVVDGKVRGLVVVYVDAPADGENPFLAEEYDLVAAVGDVLGHSVAAIDRFQQITRLTEVLRAIQGVNQLIVRERDPEQLIHKASQCLVDSRSFSACWLMLIEEGRVTSNAHAGMSDEETELLLHHYEDGGFVHLCEGRSTNEMCRLMEEGGEACPDCPLRQVAGGDTMLTQWLKHGEKTFGFIAVYADVAEPHSQQEEALLEEVADDLSLALYGMHICDQLKAEATRNAEILHSISDAFCAMDNDLVVTYYNATAERVLKRDRELVVGRQLFEAFPELLQTELEQRFQRALESGEPDEFEIYIAAEPLRNWYDIRLYPQPHGLSIYFRVITEKKLADAELRRTLNLLDETGEIARIGAWEIDLEAERVRWTHAVRLIHEVDEDFVPTVEEAVHFYPPGARERIAEALEKARKSGEPYDLEVPFVTAKGNHLFVRAWGTPEMRDGTCVRLHGIFQDITARKKSEQALRDAKLKLETAIQAGRVGLWEWDIRNDQFEYSPEWKRQIGYEAHELPNSPEVWNERVHPDDGPEVLAYVEQCLASDSEDFEVEFRLRHRDGSYRSILSQATVMRDDDGTAYRLIGSQTDITELRQAEADQERMANELQQAQKLESIGRLAGGVAHDFNNKLSIILGFTQLIMRQVKDDPIYKRLTEVEKAADSAAVLTRQLLTFARKQTINPKIIDLNELVASMLKMLGRLIGEDIELVWHPGHDVGRVRIDPGQVDQILANLMVNARDAIGGVGTVTIETRNVDIDEEYPLMDPEAKPGAYVQMVVGDTGCGMGEETISHIFEPFYTTKPQGEGTGLGLATIYGIVKQNNGFIEVKSAPNEGAVFTIFLPRLAGRPDGEDTVEESYDIPHGSETLLLVEDESALLKMAGSFLEELGYKVLATDNSAEALKLAREHADAIDLVVTDVVMPRMNGRDMIERMTAFMPGLACLYMSGYPAGLIADRGVLEKNVNFIQKPFQLHVLGRKVREILDSAAAE